jgi:sugar lactone lactonase YvrE
MPKCRWFSYVCAGTLLCGAALGQAVDLGTVAVGGSSTGTVTLTIPDSTTLTAVSVLTLGVPNLDFTDAGSDTCAVGPSYSANSTCTVNVAFSPRFAAMRYGAVVLSDASGVVTTAYLEGSGTGPQLNFLPAVESAIGKDLSSPIGTAVDGAGNVYITDRTRILKETFSGGSYTQSEVATDLQLAECIAIDGAGNLYVADIYARDVLKLIPSGSGYVQQKIASGLQGPTGVAVDSGGNVYVVDYYAGRLLKETPGPNGYTQSLIGSQFSGNSIFDVAVDDSGNLFLCGDQGGIVIETLTSGHYIESFTKGGVPGVTTGIALDRNGNIYLSDFNDNRIVRVSFTSEGSLQTAVWANVASPRGLAFDGSGNLYAVSSPNGPGTTLKLNSADGPAFNFGDVTYGTPAKNTQQTFALENIGNEPLQFPASSSAGNPALSDGFKLSTLGQLGCQLSESESEATLKPIAPGASCSLGVSFDASQIGPVSGTLVFTDNNLNAAGPAYATQTIQLAATGVKAEQSIEIKGFPNQAKYGEGPIKLTVVGGASGNPVTLAVRGPGVLNGDSIKIVGAGELTVTARQAGDLDYLPALASASVNVARAVLSVHAEDATRLYGKPNPAFKYQITGEVNGDTAARAYEGAPKLITEATLTSLPGPYAIVIKLHTLTSTNYRFVLYGATLTVEPLGKTAAPKISPATGPYQGSVTVSMSDTTPGAAIHYTTDGTTPKAGSPKYTKPFSLTATTTVKAIAVDAGYTNSAVSSATYTIGN